MLAIPTETIARVAEELLAKGRLARGYLGLRIRRVPLSGRLTQKLETAQRFAVMAIGVEAQGPAARAGIVLGDILARWNGAPVESVGDVLERLDEGQIGGKAELALFRGSDLVKVELELGERA